MYNMDKHYFRRVTAYFKRPTDALVLKRSAYSENPTPPATPATTGAGSTPNPSATTGGDEGKTPATPVVPTQPNTTTGQVTLDNLPPEIMAKFDELQEEAKKYRLLKKQAEDAAKKAEEDSLTKQQEWQKLAERRAQRIAEVEPVLEQYEQQVKEMQSVFDAILKAKLDSFPADALKEIEPVRASMKPVQFLQWLDTVAPRYLPRKAPDLNAGAGGTNGKRTLGKADIKPVAY